MQDWVRERLIKFLGDDVMKKMTKAMLMTALILGSASMGTAVEANETLHEFTLDPMVVTAQRMEMRDLDTPATVDVITRDMVERNGGASAYEVLNHALGLSATSMGPNGVSFGSMTSEVTIRGVERGTLVLLDGMPLNQDGKYNLEDIPSDIIERVEIVRSGGSVLYGSEASGGVINIITNKKAINKIKVAVGDLGRENYSVVVGGEKFGATAYYENRGDIDRTSTTAVSGKKVKVKKYYRYDDGDRKGIRWNYDINDNLTFYHQYSENKNNVSQINPDNKYKNGVIQTNNYKDTDNSFILKYDDKDGLKAHISYGTQEKDYYQTVYKENGSVDSTGLYSWRKGHNTDIDVNKRFDMGNNKLLIGATYKKEDMDIYGSKIGVASGNGKATYDRDTYSVYASYDWAMNDSDNLIINMRETFARNCGAKYESGLNSQQKDMTEFTPEVQYIKKINENSSVYAKAGKSFRLPELTRIYGSGNIKSQLDLYPEKGTHYEMGYKLNTNNAAWRLAIFNYDIKDNITAVAGTNIQAGNLQYTNTNTKNTGIELTCDIEHNQNLSSSFGIAYSNPKKEKEVGGYEKYGNRLQLSASVDYQEEKFGASIVANYFGKRLDDDVDDNCGVKVKDALYTDLHFTYTPEKNHKLFFHVNNILDREDITTNSAPSADSMGYISVGRNFMLGYEYSF